MKNQNKRGFTLVELVIVIAVIAILAGVMIATFASVVNDAKESAELQEAQQAELAQKIDDVTKKLENPNWLTWEDFENELAEQLAAINTTEGLTEASVKGVVEAALNDFAAKNLNKETGITEEQINLIVERTLAGSMTQAQVESIVKKYAANNLTANQVSSIVNAAMANSLTAAEVRAVVSAELAGVEADIASIKSNALTEAQIEAILNATFEKYGAVAQVEADSVEDITAAMDDENTTAVVVILTKDLSVTAESPLVITKNATIDLNGSAINATTPIIVNEDATVTFANGAIEKTIIGDLNAQTNRGEAIHVKAGNVALDNVTVVGGAAEGNLNFAAVKAEGKAVIIINDGTFEAAETALCGIYAAGNGTIIVENGTFEFETPIQANGTYSPDAAITIHSGEFISDGPAVFWPAGTLTITGGTFQTSCPTIIGICGGDVSITGGTFTTTAIATESESIGGDGAFHDGKSVIAVILNRSNGYTLGTVEITDGATFNYDAALEFVTVYAGTGKASELGNVVEEANWGDNITIAK